MFYSYGIFLIQPSDEQLVEHRRQFQNALYWLTDSFRFFWLTNIYLCTLDWNVKYLLSLTILPGDCWFMFVFWCRPWPVAGGTFEQLFDRHLLWSGGKCIGGRGRPKEMPTAWKEKSKSPSLTSWLSDSFIILALLPLTVMWHPKCMEGETNWRLKSAVKLNCPGLVAKHSRWCSMWIAPCVTNCSARVAHNARQEGGIWPKAQLWSLISPLFLCSQSELSLAPGFVMPEFRNLKKIRPWQLWAFQ